MMLDTAPNLAVPDGIRLAYLPPYSPELQPAEHLWPVLDEPLANQSFATLADLEHVVTERCRVLSQGLKLEGPILIRGGDARVSIAARHRPTTPCRKPDYSHGVSERQVPSEPVAQTTVQ